MMLTRPIAMLRIEGAAFFVAATLLYAENGKSWLLFALAFLAPDLAMLGYAAGARVGAAAYNALHTSVFPALLATYGLIADHSLVLSLGLIWLAHIGFDRLLGYGLKYPGGFKQTHLSYPPFRLSA